MLFYPLLSLQLRMRVLRYHSFEKNLRPTRLGKIEILVQLGPNLQGNCEAQARPIINLQKKIYSKDVSSSAQWKKIYSIPSRLIPSTTELLLKISVIAFSPYYFFLQKWHFKCAILVSNLFFVLPFFSHWFLSK